MTTPPASGRPTRRYHRVTVADTAELTPAMRRITFTGESLIDYSNEGPATHCKLVLPAPGEDGVTLPEPGGDGRQWPTDRPRPTLRTYTPRSIDRAGRRLVVDFALHGDGGPASTWAAQARAGDDAIFTDGRGVYRIDPAAGWTLLVADETALPAIATILEDAPSGSHVHLIAEVADEHERLTLPTAADLRETWVYRGDGRTHADIIAGAPATEAAIEMALPDGEGRAWVGLESGAMRVLRRHLLHERAMARDTVYTRAYWKVGVANNPDGDRGDEIE
jgi:NADPH-dependent ferric siderophore reductase